MEMDQIGGFEFTNQSLGKGFALRCMKRSLDEIKSWQLKDFSESHKRLQSKYLNDFDLRLSQ